MKKVKIIKPGTTKSQLVDESQVEFYKQYGYVLDEDVKAQSVKRKTAKPAPAAEYTMTDIVDSDKEVGNDENIGE